MLEGCKWADLDSVQERRLEMIGVVDELVLVVDVVVVGVVDVVLVLE
jgi:hypothetical protein